MPERLRQRDIIEKAYCTLKPDLDVFPLRDHKETTVRVSMFVFFLSLIIRSVLPKGMHATKLIQRCSIERMFLELENLQMIEEQSGKYVDLEGTRKHKDILETLESHSWW